MAADNAAETRGELTERSDWPFNAPGLRALYALHARALNSV